MSATGKRGITVADDFVNAARRAFRSHAGYSDPFDVRKGGLALAAGMAMLIPGAGPFISVGISGMIVGDSYSDYSDAQTAERDIKTGATVTGYEPALKAEEATSAAGTTLLIDSAFASLDFLLALKALGSAGNWSRASAGGSPGRPRTSTTDPTKRPASSSTREQARQSREQLAAGADEAKAVDTASDNAVAGGQQGGRSRNASSRRRQRELQRRREEVEIVEDVPEPVGGGRGSGQGRFRMSRRERDLQAQKKKAGTSERAPEPVAVGAEGGSRPGVMRKRTDGPGGGGGGPPEPPPRRPSRGSGGYKGGGSDARRTTEIELPELIEELDKLKFKRPSSGATKGNYRVVGEPETRPVTIGSASKQGKGNVLPRHEQDMVDELANSLATASNRSNRDNRWLKSILEKQAGHAERGALVRLLKSKPGTTAVLDINNYYICWECWQTLANLVGPERTLVVRVLPRGGAGPYRSFVFRNTAEPVEILSNGRIRRWPIPELGNPRPFARPNPNRPMRTSEYPWARHSGSGPRWFPTESTIPPGWITLNAARALHKAQ